MNFDKKDWKKKLKNFFLDNEYKTENGNLGMVLKSKRKYSNCIRIFYDNERYIYFKYRKNLKRDPDDYLLSTEISFELDLKFEIAKLSVLNLARVEVSAKDVADALVNAEIEKPKNYYLFDRGNLKLTFSDEYIFFNSGKKPLKRFESFYGYTRNIFTGENYIQIYKKKNQTLENDELASLNKDKEIEGKKENNFGNAQIVLRSIRKSFSHIDNHIFYKVSEYPVKEMSQEVKKTHLKFLS